ncbi:MAG: glycoside hydrolase family 127 protein [Gemmatimonadota bacterium]
MKEQAWKAMMSRRDALGTLGKAAVATVVLPSFGRDGGLFSDPLQGELTAVAGPHRVVVAPGRTYLNAWVGYGDPPWQWSWERRRAVAEGEEPEPSGPEPAVRWSKESGPGEVVFDDPTSLKAEASFSARGDYVLRLEADNGTARVGSTFEVTVEGPPPPGHLEPVQTVGYRMEDGFWSRPIKALMVNWIPHCIEQIERTDMDLGPGGLDNFIEAAKALRGEPHGEHKGYVFSNAWVHQTVESMCLALMVDAQGDREILDAQARFRETLDRWIPIILSAQHPDGYLQTAFTLRTPEQQEEWPDRWTPEGRSHHEGYVAGYFIESAINHHTLTEGEDTRLYDAAKKLSDLWYDQIGPPPKQAWWDGHQEMEQALVRFGRYVSDVEGGGAGDRYIELARFLLDCREDGSRYDQSHLPVVEQYEAVGHAVRAVYQYSAMADIALETRDVDYLSAVRSLHDSVVHRKYYITGGIGSGETSEGFGDDYSLPNRSYCESCSSCGQLFFQSKLNRLYQDAEHADLFEETMYNALLGSIDLEARHYYYDNPLDANIPRFQWHGCPCCVGNIPRTLLMLPTWSYAKDSDGLYVNLFVASTATVADVAGTDVEITQETQYPHDGHVAITLRPDAATRFSLRIRSPRRAVSRLYEARPEADGIAALTVNGERVEPRIERGYAVITRTWRPGDRVEVELPLRVQRVHADPRVEADRGRVALKYGPLVYNIEEHDQDIHTPLAPDAPLDVEWRPDFLEGVNVIRGRFADGTPLLAIPNYARTNRVEGTYGPKRPERPEDGSRPEPFPPMSIVWIREA